MSTRHDGAAASGEVLFDDFRAFAAVQRLRRRCVVTAGQPGPPGGKVIPAGPWPQRGRGNGAAAAADGRRMNGQGPRIERPVMTTPHGRHDHFRRLRLFPPPVSDRPFRFPTISVGAYPAPIPRPWPRPWPAGEPALHHRHRHDDLVIEPGRTMITIQFNLTAMTRRPGCAGRSARRRGNCRGRCPRRPLSAAEPTTCRSCTGPDLGHDGAVH